MQFTRGLINLKPAPSGCVATIGTFDGLHLAHRKVFSTLLELAQQNGLPAVVILFEPQPREYFQKDKAPARLLRFRQKFQLLREIGIDRLFCVRFTAELAALPPEVFIQKILLDGLQVRHLLVGDDFRFGRDRAGDFQLLQSAAMEKGFAVDRMPTFELDGERISSTRIRNALMAGDCDLASRLLGRSYWLCGKVVYGHQRGRTIGFPTANLPIHRTNIPVSGVFAVRMKGVGDAPLMGVANVGNRPTVDGTKTVLEVHLFDFTGDLYGRRVEVEFLMKVREEKKFASFDELKQQIAADVVRAREYFAKSLVVEDGE